MFSFEDREYGYKLSFRGFIRADEMYSWLQEAERRISRQGGPFCLFMDIRDLRPIPLDAQRYLEEGYKLLRNRGLLRSSIIFENPVTSMQFRRLAMQTGIQNRERYIDSTQQIDYEEQGLFFIKELCEPKTIHEESAACI